MRIYDATTFQQTGSYDFETTFAQNGNHAFGNGRAKVSRDGSLLTVTVTGGVRFIPVGDLTAKDQSLTTTLNHSVAVTLSAANILPGTSLSYSIVSAPTHGVLSGSGANLVYTPSADFFGDDSFIFEVSNNNQTSQAKISISVTLPDDSIAPGVTVSTPANRAVLASLAAIQGTATDNTDGSGIARVEFSLKRNADGLYWTGSEWGTATPIALTTSYSGGQWQSTVGLPSASTSDVAKKLADGTYTISATAYDRKNNGKGASSVFTIDKVAPSTLTITTPTNHASVTALSSISGAVADNSDGSGITKVELKLKRNADGVYWNGSTWGTAPISLSTTLQSGAWKKTSGLPSITTADTNKKLASGAYTITATGYDGAGNKKEISNLFTVIHVNHAPTANDDSLAGYEDVPLSISAATLLKNDLNGEAASDTDALKIIKVSPISGFPGTVKFDSARQTILVTTKLSWNGKTSFTYTIQDSGHLSASAKVNLSIAAVNDAPEATPTKMTAISGTTTEVEVHGNDTEGDVLTFAIQDKPDHGTAQIVKVEDQWLVRYTSKVGFSGTDTLTFKARDGKLWSQPATLTITVRANSAPQIVSLSPNKGTYATGASLTFEQKVRDRDGTSQLDAVALVISNSLSTADARNGAALWFDAQSDQFTITRNDGKGTYNPVDVGKSLANSQMSVSLEQVVRNSDGSLVLKWHLTFKSGFAGLKSLWSRAEDMGGLSVGFVQNGQVTLGSTSAPMTSGDPIRPSAPSS